MAIKFLNTVAVDTDVLYVDASSNRVGIGTTSPATKLHIADVSTPTIRIEDTTNNRHLQLFHDNNNSYIRSSVSSQIRFQTNGANDRMLIDTSGNVGIGTTSPSGKLTVADGETSGVSKTAIEFIPQDAHNRNIIFSYDRVSSVYRDLDIDANDVHFNNGGTEKMRITSSGNVGIGTTSPRGKLDIVGNTDDDTDFLTIQDNDTSAGSHRPSIRFRSNTAQIGQIVGLDTGMRFSVGTTEDSLLEIKSGGNVGIGTTSPSRKLEVNGEIEGTNLYAETYRSARTDGDIYIQASTATDFVSIGTQVSPNLMTITGAGNVGIGTTSPDAKLHIADTNKAINTEGNLFVATTDTYAIDKGGQISLGGVWHSTPLTTEFAAIAGRKQTSVNGNAGGYLQLSTSNSSGGNLTEKMRITSAGNVGIGTTTPQSKLQVAGGIQMADDTATASADKVGTMRYRTGTEYVDVTGAELVVNGSFATDTDWNKNSNWTISGGTANADGTSNNDLNQSDNLPTAGSIYRVIFEITASTQGQVRIEYGDTATDFLSALGKYEYILTAASTDRIRVQCQNSFIGSIDNLSIVEVTAEDASYADMCMQTGSSTYEWVNIVRNTY